MKNVAILLSVFCLAVSPAFADETSTSLYDTAGKWREKSIYQTVSSSWNTFLRFLVEEPAKSVTHQS